MDSENKRIYDCLIIGAGLAGLSLSIQLAKKGMSVVLLEKKQFPFHKVCGEYISMESWDFLKSLGLDLERMNLPQIKKLSVSAHNGYKINTDLPLGGFGISRYTLDNELKKIAINNNVDVLEKTSATNVSITDGVYTTITNSDSHKHIYSKLVVGAYGKYAPHFVQNQNANKSKYIAVKYHVKTNFPNDKIELHNFENGYCGISNVDNNVTCICYLTTTKNLQKHKMNIKQMEEAILFKNPFLKKYLTEATHLYNEPLTISNVYFGKRIIQNSLEIIPLGDASGSIAPLCGNGMSMALLSSYMLSESIEKYNSAHLSKAELLTNYERQWNKQFKTRIVTGKIIQSLTGKKAATLFTLKTLHQFPKLFYSLIKLTHGTPKLFVKNYEHNE